MTSESDRSKALAEAVAEFEALGSRRVRDGRGYLVIELPAASVVQRPGLKWNAFVALLSYSGLDELHPSQRDAWRAFEYESEVQNGGHGLYLQMRAGVGLDEAVASLRAVGAPSHATVLAAAAERWRGGASGALTQSTLEDLDVAFGEVAPVLTALLEAYLDDRPHDFVVVV